MSDFNFRTGEVVKTKEIHMATGLELQEMAAVDDSRFDERQLDIMRTIAAQLVSEGYDVQSAKHEAKLRVMNIAAPPDHFKVIPSKNLPYPKMIYHPNGKLKTVKNREEHTVAIEEGWLDEPQKIHMDKLQMPSQPGLRKLEKELKTQLAAVQSQVQPETEEEEATVPVRGRRK